MQTYFIFYFFFFRKLCVLAATVTLNHFSSNAILQYSKLVKIINVLTINFDFQLNRQVIHVGVVQWHTCCPSVGIDSKLASYNGFVLECVCKSASVC